MVAIRHFCSNLSRTFRALITGAPGSGKGTISSRIARDFGLVHLSSGDLLRQHVEQGSKLGVKAKDYIDKGALVPDELMLELMINEIEQLSNKSWLLDGRQSFSTFLLYFPQSSLIILPRKKRMLGHGGPFFIEHLSIWARP